MTDISQKNIYDVVVIGAGAIGLSSALALAKRRKITVLVLEAEDGVACHQTGHNSGVIHSGLYYRPGSMKALNCVRGRDLMLQFCAEHGISCEMCGKLVLATESSEVPRLVELQRRGECNGLKGVRYLEGEEIQEFEPYAVGMAGLWVPETGIVDFVQVAESYRQLLEARGARIVFGARLNWRCS